MALFFEAKTKTLSIALYPTDALTNEVPLGSVSVGLAGVDQVPILNPEGYFLFTNLPDGDYDVVVAAEYYDWYDTLSVNPASLDLINTVPGLTLRPNQFYPFPEDATLLRGLVHDQNDVPIPNADVQLQGRPEFAKTDMSGNFVLTFNAGIQETFTVEITKSGYQDETDIVTVNPGLTTNADFEMALLSDPSTALVIPTVIDSYGNPVPQATVEVASYSKSDTTDLTGQGVVALVLGSSSENVTVTVNQVGFAEDSQVIAVNQGQTANYNVTLSDDFNSTIARLIPRTREGTTNIEGARIEIIEKGRVALSAPDGRARFYFDDLGGQNQTVTMRATAAGYLPATETKTIVEGAQRTETIQMTPIP